MPSSFSATIKGRIPTRPLSYANVDQAVNKELIVDYSTGGVYVKDESGNIHNITDVLYSEIITNHDFAADIKVTLSDGTQVILNTEIQKILSDLGLIQATYDTQTDGSLLLKPAKINYDADHRAVSDTEKAKWNAKTDISTIYATIGTTWTGTEEPYTQTITVSGILATDTPIIDVILNDSLDYTSVQDILDAYGNFYRITTQDGSITVYSKDVTTVNVPVQMKVNR